MRTLICLGLLLLGCRSEELLPPGAAVDLAVSRTDMIVAASDLSTTAADLALAIHCPGTFPTFDRSCSSASDCVIGLHQVNCCGSFAALGLNKSEQARFDAAEKVCEAQYPACGCASVSTVADDGSSERQEHPIVVGCVSGSCRTSAP